MDPDARRRWRTGWWRGWAVALVVAATGLAQAVPPTPPGVPAAEVARARHVLERLGFGPRPGEVERVAAMGVERWIAQQLAPDTIDDHALQSRLGARPALAVGTAELFRRYPTPAALRRQLAVDGASPGPGAGLAQDAAPGAAGDGREQARQRLAHLYREQGYGRPQELYLDLAADRLLRATYSERQLQEVMVDFWSNHFNVYARKSVLAWYLPAFDREVIRPHALGRFRDLLLASARSPAMLLYLDNVQSVSPRLAQRLPGGSGPRRATASADGRAARRQAALARLPSDINENYARELMELHTLGVEGGYTQQDIREVARAFTGWTIADARGLGLAGASAGAGRPRTRLGMPADVPAGAFYFNSVAHDPGPKTVLGQRIDAGGEGDGVAVIDLLARQPATARMIAHKLAVRFVSDTPPPALVARVASVFTRSEGDIRATLRALFSDPLFFDPAHDRAKVKTPFELVASSLRALQAQTDGRQVQAFLADLGEPLYGHAAPTGYPDQAADWVNDGALLKRMNFAAALAANRIPGTRVDLAVLGVGSGPALLDAGLARWLAGVSSGATRAALRPRLGQPLPMPTLASTIDGDDALPLAQDGGRQPRQLRLLPPSGDPAHVEVATLVLGSPDFQRQ